MVRVTTWKALVMERHLQQSHPRKLLCQTENYGGIDGFCYWKVGVTDETVLDYFLFHCQDIFVETPELMEASHDFLIY